MRNNETDLYNWIKWLLVLPMFVVSFVFLGVFFRIVFNLVVITPLLAYNNLQLEFIVRHVYLDLFCLGFSIYFSSLTAPTSKGKITISSIYLILVYIFIPKLLEIAQMNNFYGEQPWKIPFLVTLYVLAGLLPLLLISVEEYRRKISLKLQSDKSRIEL